MTPEEALDYFLDGPRTRSDNLRVDVIAALQEAARRRVEGPIATATVVLLAHDRLKMSYQDIEDASFNEAADGACIDDETARRLVIRYFRTR